MLELLWFCFFKKVDDETATDYDRYPNLLSSYIFYVFFFFWKNIYNISFAIYMSFTRLLLNNIPYINYIFFKKLLYIIKSDNSFNKV